MPINTANKKESSVEEKIPSLVQAILSDLFLTHWLVSLLVVLFILSAMLQAKTSHQTRVAVTTWQNLRESNQQQQIKYQALRLEITSLTEADRIARLARKQLGMIDVTNKTEKVINL